MDYENYDNDANSSDADYFAFVEWLSKLTALRGGSRAESRHKSGRRYSVKSVAVVVGVGEGDSLAALASTINPGSTY